MEDVGDLVRCVVRGRRVTVALPGAEKGVTEEVEKVLPSHRKGPPTPLPHRPVPIRRTSVVESKRGRNRVDYPGPRSREGWGLEPKIDGRRHRDGLLEETGGLDGRLSQSSTVGEFRRELVTDAQPHV